MVGTGNYYNVGYLGGALLFQFKGYGAFDVARRSSDYCLELAGFGNPLMFRVVEETQRSLVDSEADGRFLAGSKFHFPESFKFLERARQGGFLVGDVELYCLASFAVAGILHIDGYGDGAVGGHRLFVGGRFALSLIHI